MFGTALGHETREAWKHVSADSKAPHILVSGVVPLYGRQREGTCQEKESARNSEEH